jgi:hypothetical protein
VKDDPSANLGNVLTAHAESIATALDNQEVRLSAPEAGAKILGEEDAKVVVLIASDCAGQER